MTTADAIARARARKLDSFEVILEELRVSKSWTYRMLLDVLRVFTPSAWEALRDAASARSGVDHSYPSVETRERLVARIEGKALAEAFGTVDRLEREIRKDLRELGRADV